MRLAWVLLVLGLAATACGSDADGASPTPASNASAAEAGASSTSADVPALVGEWSRLTTCQQRVDALQAAGLGDFAAEHAAGEGWIPGVTSVDALADPTHPCTGAKPLVHSHFFTADGMFGSRDAQGNQVDDGTYEVTDPATVVIDKEFGQVTFHFQVTPGDRLLLDPVMPDCAAEGCFAAQWAVSVAYPGLPWERVE